MNTPVKGTMIASLAIGLFQCGGSNDTPKDPSGTTAQIVKCVGINECATKGECGGLDGNTCAGTNKCRGKGWIKVPAEQCSAKGGKPLGS